jgi:hypothetical protein
MEQLRAPSEKWTRGVGGHLVFRPERPKPPTWLLFAAYATPLRGPQNSAQRSFCWTSEKPARYGLIGCSDADLKRRVGLAMFADFIANVILAFVLIHAIVYAEQVALGKVQQSDSLTGLDSSPCPCSHW